MPIYYVTRDIERALGRKPDEHYRIIANTGSYAESIRKKYPQYVSLISRQAGDPLLDTYSLLDHAETKKIITEGSSVIVFKNTSAIETFCKEKKWKLLNPSAALAEKIENKISQVEWLGETARYLPPHAVVKVSMISSTVKRPCIIQWAHSHTGDGTILIPSGVNGDKILAELKKKFPDRQGRVTEYIRGPMFTVNVCIVPEAGREKMRIGNISYQITGILPFTDNPFATIGNDWSLPHGILSEKKLAEFREITEAVGQRMIAVGWSGLFGIDCIYDEERDRLHLIEVNARQPASTTYESKLQEKISRDVHGAGDRMNNKVNNQAGMTLFEAHIAALTDMPCGSIIAINDGAQIIDRVKNNFSKIPAAENSSEKIADELRQKKYTVIEYENTKPGADRMRIQSERGIMSAHNAFNSRGKEIMAIVSGIDFE